MALGHRFHEIKPAHHPTKEEVQEMIDDAIRQHNRNAELSVCLLVFLFLHFLAEGLASTYWSDTTAFALVENFYYNILRP